MDHTSTLIFLDYSRNSSGKTRTFDALDIME
jgi:hypothetical protein